MQCVGREQPKAVNETESSPAAVLLRYTADVAFRSAIALVRVSEMTFRPTADNIVGLAGWTAWIETKAMARWACDVASRVIVDSISKTLTALWRARYGSNREPPRMRKAAK